MAFRRIARGRETYRNVLLALQTTANGIDDGTLDAVTLVLLAGFVVSMVALSVLLARGNRDTPEDSAPQRPEKPESPGPVSEARARPEMRSAPVAERMSPVWLGGVTLPHVSGVLGEATSMIERLLDARRERNLVTGIALYSPALRARLASELGVSVEGLGRALETASFAGEAPGLRSVELITAAADVVMVRAGYADRSTELYQFVRIDGRWLIDSIERA